MDLKATLDSLKNDLDIHTEEFEYICFTDGGIAPINPGGEMTIGALVVRNDGLVIHSISESFAPHHSNTNNIAEQMAMQRLLLWFLDNNILNEPILVLSDSMLVVKYCKFICGSSDSKQSEIGTENQNIIRNFDRIIVDHIPRKYNYYADMLSTKSSKMQKMQNAKWTTLGGVKRTENYNKYVDELIKIYATL